MTLPFPLAVACCVCAVAVPASCYWHAWETRTGKTPVSRALDAIVSATLIAPVAGAVGAVTPILFYGLGLVLLSMLGVQP